MSTILVLVDHDHGTPGKVANQLLTAARNLADEVHAAVFGPGAAGAAKALGAYGVGTAYVWDDEAADAFVTEPRVAALEAALAASGASVLLYPADPFQSDVVARTAIRLGGGVVTDASELERTDDGLVATKQIFGGAMQSQCRVHGDRLQCYGVKPNAFAASETGAGAAEIVELEVTLNENAQRAKVVEIVEQSGGDRPEMTEASIICAGGRGLGGAEGFALIERLADALGGAVGASRAATDAGWYPHQHQIGQTGKTVAPQLYIGAGISGAIQHRAGMQTSQLIVAINKDGEVPIFSIADFGVVGDLHQVVPALIDEIERRKG